jgi:glycosyltransferase involved in cell wall biosynthesis
MTSTTARRQSISSEDTSPGERVAIVHDYLTQRGGAERVVLALHDAFPEAPIHTSLFHPEGTFPEFSKLPIQTSKLNHIGVLRRHHRLAMPLLAPTFSSTRIDADVVVCSSSGWAHGVRTAGRKVVYCYAPARWLYQTDAYLAGRGRVARAAMSTMGPALKRWDRRAARSADVYVTISTHSQRLIREIYGIEAEVVNPPCNLDADGAVEEVVDLEPGYFLCVSRLLPYKHIDAVLGAFEQLRSERIVVVGTGPEAARLRRLAPPNAVFLATVTDDELRCLYDRARALVAASFEDFGLTPVEAATFGTPALALRFGGYFDSVVEDVTGLFFDEPTPTAIADAIRRLDAANLDANAIREHGRRFSTERFNDGFRELVTDRRESRRTQ